MDLWDVVSIGVYLIGAAGYAGWLLWLAKAYAQENSRARQLIEREPVLWLLMVASVVVWPVPLTFDLVMLIRRRDRAAG